VKRIALVIFMATIVWGTLLLGWTTPAGASTACKDINGSGSITDSDFSVPHFDGFETDTAQVYIEGVSAKIRVESAALCPSSSYGTPVQHGR